MSAALAANPDDEAMSGLRGSIDEMGITVLAAGPQVARKAFEENVSENMIPAAVATLGTLEQLDTMWALVIARDGTLFRVHAGNYMGQNHGQITRIAEDRIELTEIVPDGTGGWQERQASVALSE